MVFFYLFILLLNKRDQIQNVSNIIKGQGDKLLSVSFKDCGDDMRHVLSVFIQIII